MESLLELVRTYGLAVVLLMAVLCWIVKFVNRVMDESQSRELRLMSFTETIAAGFKDLQAEVSTVGTKQDRLEGKQDQIITMLHNIGR